MTNKSVAISLTLITLVLSACSTHWAFPPGKNVHDFRSDEAACNAVRANFVLCLSAKGYRQISYEEMIKLNQQAAKKALEPYDIVVLNLASQELWMGKARLAPGAESAPISLHSLTGSDNCNGYGKLKQFVTGGTGSMGFAELICKDGRKLIGDFVFDQPTSGYGRGSDSFQNNYLFLFGQLDSDITQLRERFEKLGDKKQLNTPESGA